LRVDHVTLERILPRVWESFLAVYRTVENIRQNKTVIVIRIVFALLILYAIFGFIRKTGFAPSVG